MDERAEAYEKLLSSNLARAFELLKFAEAKSGALLAFASVWIVACFNLLAPDRVLPDGVKLAASCALPLWALAATFGIWTFLPRMERSVTFDEANPSPTSLLFAGDIAKRSVTDFRSALEAQFYPAQGNIPTQQYLNDLTGQIHAVSAIATRKFKLFHWGAVTALAALGVLGLPFLVLLLRSICHAAAG